MKLAITGKGGVGKTTLAGGLARLYAEEGRQVIAVDADPATNLWAVLGFSLQEAQSLAPLAEMADLIEERTGAKPGTTGGFFRLNPRVDDLPEKIALKKDGIRLMVMGTVRRGGSGCLCAENALIRALIQHLILYRDDVVILDMEAGIEHMGRAVAQGVDALITVVEPGMRSVQTAFALQRLAGDIGVHRVFVVANKVRSPREAEILRQRTEGLTWLGAMPYYAEAVEADLQGESPFSRPSPLLEAVRAIRARLDDEIKRS
jgi:CO dehydrogenase maturation factor